MSVNETPRSSPSVWTVASFVANRAARFFRPNVRSASVHCVNSRSVQTFVRYRSPNRAIDSSTPLTVTRSVPTQISSRGRHWRSWTGRAEVVLIGSGPPSSCRLGLSSGEYTSCRSGWDLLGRPRHDVSAPRSLNFRHFRGREVRSSRNLATKAMSSASGAIPMWTLEPHGFQSPTERSCRAWPSMHLSPPVPGKSE